MTSEPKLFRVNPQDQATDRIDEVDFGQLGIQERWDIQEWVAANPDILGENLLIVAKEFSGFDRTNERLDLLAVDDDGKLVVVELKRDDTGSDAHWQAIKYASYVARANEDDVTEMLASHENITPDNARERLIEHLGADDLKALNNDQRIVLASHRFAPEVTSAALWLNDQAPGENLVTCVKLTPHRDANSGSLYVQASTIIPVPGDDEFVITVGDNSRDKRPSSGSSLGAKLRKTFARNKSDEVTRFLREVRERVMKDLPGTIRPNKFSKWAGGWPEHRYYHFWYRRPPWGNWILSYRINLYPHDGTGMWRAEVELAQFSDDLGERLSGLTLHESQRIESGALRVVVGANDLNSTFAEQIAQMTRTYVEQITPIVDSFEDESNEEDA